MLTNLWKRMAGMVYLITMYNHYTAEKDSKKVAYVIQQQGLAMADASISLAQLRPQIIEKTL